jgi:hypothetical protein
LEGQSLVKGVESLAPKKMQQNNSGKKVMHVPAKQVIHQEVKKVKKANEEEGTLP